MELNDFIKRFSACLNHTDAAGIGPQTEFKKLDEWSSILALIVIAMVDSDYQKTLVAEDIRSATTLEDLFKKIESR